MREHDWAEVRASRPRAFAAPTSPDAASCCGDEPGVVIVLDDDPSVQSSMDSLLRSVGLRTLCFGAAQAVLDARLPDAPTCIIVDVRMPLIGGFEFCERMAEQSTNIPVIFITGHGDIPMGVRAMKAGAIDFLPKPFREQDLLDAVTIALNRDRDRRDEAARIDAKGKLYDRLTPREREVMEGVCRGLMNKQVAYELGIAEITVKLHRASMMKKLGARNFAELIRINDALIGPVIG